MSGDDAKDPADALPDSDDPYEVLGLSPDADRKALKRAHAKLIKRFRPDRDPESFQRVQAAFEQAKRWAKFQAQLADQVSSEPDHQPDAASDASSYAELPTAPEPPRLWPSRPPATRSISRVDWMEEGIKKGARFELEDFETLSRTAFVELAGRPALRWAVLAQLPQRELALSLHRERFEQFLVDDEISRALRESDALMSELVHEPQLEAQVWRVAAYAAWRYYPKAESLAAGLGGDLQLQGEAEHLADAFEDIRRVAANWAHARRRPMPSALTRFVELGRVVSRPICTQLRAAVAKDLPAQAPAYAKALETMAGMQPEGTPRGTDALSFVWESFAMESSYGVPSYDLLEDAELAQLDAALVEIENKLAPAPHAGARRLSSHLLMLGLVVSLSVAHHPYVGVLGYFAYRYFSGERAEEVLEAFDESAVHRALMQAAMRGALPPGCALEHLDRNPERFPGLLKLRETIQVDQAVDTMAMVTWTVARWDPEPAH